MAKSDLEIIEEVRAITKLDKDSTPITCIKMVEDGCISYGYVKPDLLNKKLFMHDNDEDVKRLIRNCFKLNGIVLGNDYVVLCDKKGVYTVLHELGLTNAIKDMYTIL